jgi:hypothetical protein
MIITLVKDRSNDGYGIICTPLHLKENNDFRINVSLQSFLQRSILLLLILSEIHLDVFPSVISLLSICQRFPMYGATDEELAEAMAIAGQTDHFLK